MREFRIKVNNEKTYVVKANDYNQAVKTLHSKLRDFDDTKKNINVVREFITNNGGKFSKSKDADAILDFIYKKTGVKNADYGDVLYIVRNYTNVKVEDNTVTDFDLTNFLALKRSLELRIGEEIDFDKLEEYVNKLPKDKNGKKNIDVKEVIKRCIKAKDNAVSDSISRYTGEDAIRTNGFVKIKEDGDWTSYKYNGSDFDGAVFKIHQYNPSLIAFVSNGNRTITVRNKYLNDSADTAQGEIEVLKSFGFDYKDGKWVKESNNNNIIVQPDYHYVSVIGPDDTEKHCKKYQYQSAGMLKKIIASNIKDSSITDTDMKTAEEIIKKYGGNPVGNVMGLQKTRFVGQDEIKNQHDFATDLDKAGYKFYLINGRYRISPKDSSIKDDLTMVEKYKKSIIYIDDNGYYYHTPIGGRGAKAQRDNTKDINIVKKRIDNDYSFLYDSSIKDVSYVSGKNLKIGQKIVEDGEVLEVVDIKETQRGINNNYRDITFKNVKTGATETVHFVNSTLARLNDYSPKYNKGQKIQTSAGIHEIIGYDPVRADVHTNRIEYSYRLKTPNGTYTNIPDWQLEELVKLGRYKLIDSSIKDVDWDFANKLKQHSQEEIRNALKYSAPTVYKQYRNGETIQFAGLAGQLTGPEKTKVLKRLGDSNILSGYKYRIINNGTKWYYETTFPDGHTTLTGPYSSKQETEQYFHKHRPTEKLTDADPVKVEKIIRKEKSALGITYYIFQTKSSSGYTIYYQVTDKTYHGEPTYSGGGIISFSLKSANDTLDHNLLSDKLKAKYGEKEGTKRYLRGENDSAIKDKLSTSDANSLVEAYIDKYKYTHSNLPYVNKPKIKIFNSPEEFRDKFLSSYRGYSIYAGGLLNYNGYVVKLFTSAKDGKIESPSADNIFTIFPTTAIKDSNNIKNRKSYTIKVGDKQYKVFAESESEAINKYIKSKK